jgi:hypothetical protein
VRRVTYRDIAVTGLDVGQTRVSVTIAFRHGSTGGDEFGRGRRLSASKEQQQMTYNRFLIELWDNNARP